MLYTIYKTTNLLDGKIYIGKHQTTNLDDGYIGSGKRLHYAIKKYGLQNFVKEILFIFETEVEMNDKEAELVTEEFCLKEDTYNLCPGGKGGWGYANDIIKTSVNTFENPNIQRKAQERGNESKRKKLLDPDHRLQYSLKLSNSLKGKDNGKWLGRNHSEETKVKMRKPKNIGENNSQYGLQWITNGIESTRIKKDDPIPEGWNKGRKYCRNV